MGRRDVGGVEYVKSTPVNLSDLKEHPRIAKFRNFIQGWYLLYFSPSEARDLPLCCTLLFNLISFENKCYSIEIK